MPIRSNKSTSPTSRKSSKDGLWRRAYLCARVVAGMSTVVVMSSCISAEGNDALRLSAPLNAIPISSAAAVPSSGETNAGQASKDTWQPRAGSVNRPADADQAMASKSEDSKTKTSQVDKPSGTLEQTPRLPAPALQNDSFVRRPRATGNTPVPTIAASSPLERFRGTPSNNTTTDSNVRLSVTEPADRDSAAEPPPKQKAASDLGSWKARNANQGSTSETAVANLQPESAEDNWVARDAINRSAPLRDRVPSTPSEPSSNVENEPVAAKQNVKATETSSSTAKSESSSVQTVSPFAKPERPNFAKPEGASDQTTVRRPDRSQAMTLGERSAEKSESSASAAKPSQETLSPNSAKVSADDASEKIVEKKQSPSAKTAAKRPATQRNVAPLPKREPLEIATKAKPTSRKRTTPTDLEKAAQLKAKSGDGASATVGDMQSEPAMLDYTGRPTGELKPNRSVRSLKRGIERTLRYFYLRPEVATGRSNWGLMHAMMVYGPDTKVQVGNNQYSAIAWIAGNNNCRGQRLLTHDADGIKAKNGAGLQGHQGQFLAVLGMCNVPTDYPLYASKQKYLVSDLIDAEKRACEPGVELTFTLIAFSHYMNTDAVWLAEDGSRWDFERLISEELKQPIVGAACGGTHRLMGFAHALRKRRAEGKPITGHWKRAETYLQDFTNYAYSLQNRDGSMSTRWFEGRGDNGEVDRKIQTTGHIVEWLLTVTPDDQLQNPRLVSAVRFLLRSISSDLEHDWSIGPKGHSLRSLAMYHQRVFRAGSPWLPGSMANSKTLFQRR